MSLKSLKNDFLEMLELKGDISKYNQMLIHHNNKSDTRNFNPEKCKQLIKKVNELQERFFFLKEKWFE